MKFRLTIRTITSYTICLMLVMAYPYAAYAEESTAPAATSETSTPATATSTESPQQPTAPEPAAPIAPTAPAPAAPVAPKPPEPVYTYDAVNNRWNTDEWQYDAASNTYKQVVPTQSTQTVASPTSPLAPSSGATDASSVVSSETRAAIANTLDSIALTGNAGIFGNTSAGNATSGDASATTTVVNSVNSTLTNTNNKEVASFVTDVMGDVNGDIMLQPVLLKAMLEANIADNTAIKSSTSTGIQNDINLAALSGDAAVRSNTSAGSATTGSANTVADVVNIVNSMVAANQSFMGTINIYGNLNGDILVAPDFIPQLMASNAGTDSESLSGSTIVDSNDTQTIVNNVSLAAESGAALVAGNTAAGNATSGTAATNLVIFNLSGHEIVAENSLLVFINVLGTWVGVIVDAPKGATAAAVGSGVSKNTVSPSLVIDAANETQITNNINLASSSGDATVEHNTKAGDATTGNATASANIANISGSQIGLTGWFGILFINVFGSWNGSFGVDTVAGDVVDEVERAERTGEPVRVMRFVPRSERTERTQTPFVTAVVNPTGGAANRVVSSANVAAASASSVKSSVATASDFSREPVSALARAVNTPLAIGSLVIAGLSTFVLRRHLF